MASSAALVLPSATCAPSGLRHPPVVNACAGAPSVPTSIAFVSGAFAGQRVSQRVWNSRVTERVASVSVRASAAESTKELERFSAKGDLLLSIKDAGGLKGLGDRKTDSSAKIDVNEKILVLERMNPTPRPTTSPFLEGLWEFQYAGARSPGLVAAKILLKRFPSALASLTSLTLTILDGENAKATGTLKFFNSVESSFTLTTKLAVEGPVKLKEQYVEGLFAPPTVTEGNIPSQFKGIADQIASAVERLPSSVKEVINGGVKLPLTNTFSRELLISYLDEEVMVVRDKSGIPDVLVRIEAPATDMAPVVVVPEYVS
ncbi:hypothetical protein MPTK1_4g22980 [Marchantia polymorpha subsp. ruderalis]|uniref:Plastid lipid-associated protein/fibrillin conserved domain-containing protein n=2 Tax=Marchantia polymorpha TaxID=3197 RepID=A0A176W8V6_MARPO|nr:hypothetical protein AXG93_4548s1220 [Marchantia polymorpha subsp. ruderalis]PTQ44396.1 hypothetical protein MARPO_0020s0060 [Marchantia polymorpha]BBN09821.1 hypothetical protein Mp_4g22980 [Marchantia polymorpha subsp. ruderalis]|eukprot:PTQ44396.1 hypothetical protein MARPO_0020s0060 [Marchantia polymorpha]